MAKGQKTIYKNGAVILRMVLGILTIVISVIVDCSLDFSCWLPALLQLLPEKQKAALLQRSFCMHSPQFSLLQI